MKQTIKEIRQVLSVEKLFLSNLYKIWGGSANIEKLAFGVRSAECSDEFDTTTELEQDSSSNCDAENGEELCENGSSSSPNGKGKPSAVPKLIDNKANHLEHNLSAAQREMKEPREEAQRRKEMPAAMRESNSVFFRSNLRSRKIYI